MDGWKRREDRWNALMEDWRAYEANFRRHRCDPPDFFDVIVFGMSVGSRFKMPSGALKVEAH